MKRAKHTLKILAILTAVFFVFSCNPIEKDSKSATMLIVKEITGTDFEGNSANFLQSDVIKESEGGTVYADIANATLSARLLDPDPKIGSSHHNNIQLTRYVVTYSRSDGKSGQGIDIPYSFEGSLTILIEVDSSVDISFIIVRAAAKLESPLVDLSYPRGEEGELKVKARIDFYGHDLGNRKVMATGNLTIYFANYTDEE